MCYGRDAVYYIVDRYTSGNGSIVTSIRFLLFQQYLKQRKRLISLSEEWISLNAISYTLNFKHKVRENKFQEIFTYDQDVTWLFKWPQKLW